MKLDEIDKRILKALQERGRISNAELADSINLSQSACYRRVQRLEDEGFVKEYLALLDTKKWVFLPRFLWKLSYQFKPMKF